MGRFVKGDNVKVRSDLIFNKSYSGYYLTSSMVSMIGVPTTITHVLHDGYRIKNVFPVVSDEMLEEA